MLTENDHIPRAVKPPAAADATGGELDVRATRQVDDLETYINRNVSEVGHRWEAIADRSFDALFDGDVSAALAGRRFATPKYDALAARAGTTLTIDQPALSRAVRIGAVNHRLARTRWASLPWSLKVELMPLLGAEQDFGRIGQGVEVARKEGVTVRELRQWVADHRTEDEKRAPQTPKLTPLKAAKAFAATAALRKADGRRALAAKVHELDADGHKAFLAALADALRNLSKLQQELLNDDE
jgi:hypothetical protein